MKATVTMSSKGQLTLPASVRAVLGLQQGDRLELSVDETNGLITIAPVIDIEELSARVSGYAMKRSPVTDVDDYYQQNRGRSSKS